MTNDIRQRLSRANPAHLADSPPPDMSALGLILGTTRAESAGTGRRHPRRRALVLALAVAIAVIGTAAGWTRFAPHYFDSGDSETPPADLVATLERLADQPGRGGSAGPDLAQIVRLADFETAGHGRATIYAMPMSGGAGFCSADTIGDGEAGLGCYDDEPGDAIPAHQDAGSSLGNVELLYGRLAPSVAGIEVELEDGAVRDASVRDRYWIYLVGGDETDPGHRPVGLVARSPAGERVAVKRLDPASFTRN